MALQSTKIVILHGWGQHKSFWVEIISKLKLDYDASAIDLPGFGTQKLISADWGIPEYADWVANYLQEHQLNNAIVIGHSFGGRIAAYMTANKLYKPKALILYGAPLLYRPSLSTKNKILINKLIKKIFPPQIRSKFINNQELLDADKQGQGKIFRKVVNFDQTTYLPAIDTKTLLIWGEQDIEVPLDIAHESNRLIPNSELVILPNLGHNAHLENPNLFYGKIKNFITTIS